MRAIRILTVSGLLLTSLLSTGLYSTARAEASSPAQVYNNETAITFTTNDGQTTEAYEGFFKVPENRNHANSRMIDVHYVRFPATNNSKGKKAEKGKKGNKGNPIVYLSGGPGGSGIATAKWKRFPLFMALREHGDVIALDQRGTGKSENTPECISQQVLPLTEVLSEAEISSRYREAANECIKFWQQQGADPYGYTTVQNALDIEDLRKHLQADKVSLWGISYGSHLAFAAMKEMEQHIDKVIIASAEGLDQTVKLPARTDEYFSRVQHIINQNPQLAARFSDIKTMIYRVHQKLEQKPMAVKIPQKDGSQLDFLFQKQHMQGIASMMIADPGQYLTMLLNLYQTLEHGSTQMLTAVLQRGMFNDPRIKFRMMPLAMDVASGVSDEQLNLIKQQAKSSLLGEMLNFPMPLLNKAIPGLDLGDDFRKAPQNDIPTLLLTGTLDGRTYVEGQKDAVRGLTNLTQVTVENAGHNLFTVSPKVLEVMHQFMKGEKVSTTTIEVAAPSFKM